MVKKDLKDYIVEELENLKIEDIIVIDTSKTSSIADWVIIGSGRSGKHIESSMENLKINIKNSGLYEGGIISGVANDGWIIYDLGNIIVHLFVPAVRDIYKLEELFNTKSKPLILDEKKAKTKNNTKNDDDKKNSTKKISTKQNTKTNKNIVLKKKTLTKKSTTKNK